MATRQQKTWTGLLWSDKVKLNSRFHPITRLHRTIFRSPNMYKVVPKKQSVNSTYSCSKPRERRLLQLPSGTRVRAHVHVLPGICEKREKKISYMWAAELSLGPSLFLPWQWKQIQLTLISVFSQTLYVWEKASLCPHSIKAWSLPLLNMLIHLAPPPPPCSFSPAHKTPTAPLSLPK